MDKIIVDIAAMWPGEISLPVLEIETETQDNISTHLKEKMTFILEGIDNDQINNCITIPTGWLGWWGTVEKEARSIERKRKKVRKRDKGGREKKL